MSDQAKCCCDVQFVLVAEEVESIVYEDSHLGQLKNKSTV